MSLKEFKRQCVEDYYRKLNAPDENYDDYESVEDTSVEFQPLTWDDYVGQSMLKNRLQVRVHSAKNRGAPLPPTLLVAPPGAGKTTLARLIADTMGRSLITVTKPLDSAELVSKLWSYPENSVLFVDEVHTWSKKQQHTLMQLTESKTLDGPTGVMRFDELSIVLATTDPENLVAPLVSRMMVTPEWDDYSDEDMAGIISGMAGMVDVDEWCTEDMVKVLVKATGGVPRQAKLLVTALRDLVYAGVSEVDGPTVLGFLDMEPDGLTSQHITYLQKLAGQPKQQAGLEAMASLCGVSKEQVKQTERVLLRNNYVVYSKSGRMLTPNGRNRIKGRTV